MTLLTDLQAEVKAIFGDIWKQRDGRTVPEPEELKLGNDAVLLDATVLYADLSGSTKMVDSKKASLAAEIYKSFLHCAAKIVKAEGGSITGYDGDRIMAVFIGDSKNTSAMRSGLKINWAVQEIVNPSLKAHYTSETYVVKQVVGIDTSKLWVARIGVRNDNDLVWVGRAANYAAKLTEIDSEFRTWVTGAVYSGANVEAKFTDGKPMWEERRWTKMNDMQVYGSTWRWKV